MSNKKEINVALDKLWKAYKLRFMVFMDKLHEALAKRHLRLAKPQTNDVSIFPPDVERMYVAQIYKEGENRPGGDVHLILLVDWDMEFEAPGYTVSLRVYGYRGEDPWVDKETPWVRFGDPGSRDADEEELQEQLAAWTSEEGIKEITGQIVKGFHRTGGPKDWEPAMGSSFPEEIEEKEDVTGFAIDLGWPVGHPGQFIAVRLSHWEENRPSVEGWRGPKLSSEDFPLVSVQPIICAETTVDAQGFWNCEAWVSALEDN